MNSVHFCVIRSLKQAQATFTSQIQSLQDIYDLDISVMYKPLSSQQIHKVIERGNQNMAASSANGGWDGYSKSGFYSQPHTIVSKSIEDTPKSIVKATDLSGVKARQKSVSPRLVNKPNWFNHSFEERMMSSNGSTFSTACQKLNKRFTVPHNLEVKTQLEIVTKNTNMSGAAIQLVGKKESPEHSPFVAEKVPATQSNQVKAEKYGSYKNFGSFGKLSLQCVMQEDSEEIDLLQEETPDFGPEQSESSVIPQQKSSVRNTVLIVDDQECIRFVLTKQISYLGFETAESMDGTHGLHTALKMHDSLCCIVTDFDMPGMDGMTLAQELRLWETGNSLNSSHPGKKFRVPVVLCSGDETEEADVKEFGVDATVTKPANLSIWKKVFARLHLV